MDLIFNHNPTALSFQGAASTGRKPMPHITDNSLLARPARLWALAAVAAALFLPGCGEDKPSAAPAALPKVVVAEVRQVQAPREYIFNGVLAAKETVEVRARVSGYVAEKLFEEGSRVAAGQVLYKLDDRDLVAALNTAKANTAKAKAAWENADITRKRMVQLADKGAISQQQRDNAVSKADEALAAYQAAEAEEEKASVNLGYATITASTSGFVSRSNVEVGSNVDAGSATLMTTVYKVNPIRAEFSVSDKQYSEFRQRAAAQGAEEASKGVEFYLLLGDERNLYKYPGTLEMADPVIDSRTNTLGVRVQFPNPDDLLRPGMFVNVQIKLSDAEALVVPEVALVEQSGGKIVYVLGPNDILETRAVSVGEKIGEDRVITEGLSLGQKVVVEGLVTARAGLKVEPVASSSSASEAAESSEQP